MSITYYSITNVKFDSAGNIIFKTGSSTIPAQNSNENRQWDNATSKTIYDLQKTAFSDLNQSLRELQQELPASMQTYFNALDKIIQYNKDNINATQILFYDQRNGSVDYTAYEKLVQTRDSIKAKMDYINN